MPPYFMAPVPGMYFAGDGSNFPPPGSLTMPPGVMVPSPQNNGMPTTVPHGYNFMGPMLPSAVAPMLPTAHGGLSHPPNPPYTMGWIPGPHGYMVSSRFRREGWN